MNSSSRGPVGSRVITREAERRARGGRGTRHQYPYRGTSREGTEPIIFASSVQSETQKDLLTRNALSVVPSTELTSRRSVAPRPTRGSPRPRCPHLLRSVFEARTSLRVRKARAPRARGPRSTSEPIPNFGGEPPTQTVGVRARASQRRRTRAMHRVRTPRRGSSPPLRSVSQPLSPPPSRHVPRSPLPRARPPSR